ncbi:fumarylacetoacetate hydrolase family protein [Brevibacillus migulae]|uniref:fumarylacetoacetate hydrolase family protein n=1 Tax=Brevibacillus migulae TaxID=1644114 RepID=UPI00106E032E|nr:fumarylacetoacetate hydrolase family protein [Brevibacillus migulae]
MKIVTFYREEKLQVGVKTEAGILDVAQAKQDIPGFEDIAETVHSWIETAETTLPRVEALLLEAVGKDHLFHEEEQVKLGPCVPRPGKIICIGLNYRKHAEESKMPIPQYPILFNKFANTVSAHNDVIELPVTSEKVDYEAELVIVIGKKAKHVAKEAALDHVFGYCNVNDLSARDLQMRTPQWLLGKSCDGFSPLGPYLVTADEVGNPNQLGIRAYVNGELRQDSNTADMIFHCDEIVSYISKHMTLEPGDIIMTGTPEGVILGYPEEKQVWLKEGDEVTIEIDGLGRLTNRFVNEQLT